MPSEDNRSDRKNERTEAQPIRSISDPESGEVIAWVYRWNTGEEENCFTGRLPGLMKSHLTGNLS